ncbi:nuclear transport factor 2 family protein [Pararhizobium mangrovi]|uniref:Ester cyclase n=1 Tax=Pararhizobium mangrovi TaxID=2590452 RepID=A0A506U7C7_9HYPH|nr:ester cyclase [Pararhizobium mangrovi]TPW28984.1 ester cyclase [Pararhizobium mangrovi]
MAKQDETSASAAPTETASKSRSRPGGDDVLQSERLDFTDLVPENRPRAQSMQGFDDCYTDIVDYIVRCTHKIWDERDVGLIYTHYTHNCVLYGTMGTMYNREDVVRDTIQRLVSLPERRGMATQVIWSGDDREGFYTSHLVTGSGRHSQNGHYGPATGRRYASRTVADCMIYANKIYREWVVADQMAIIRQLGIDVDAYATKLATAKLSQGLSALDIGETGLMLGQYPPAETADTSIASNDIERTTLEWLHAVWNRKMFGRLRSVYAPTVMYHGPLMKELYGVTSVTHQVIGLIGALPDAVFAPQHICSVPCTEGGTKVAVRWILEGHHLGYGGVESFGDPTGKQVQVMGMSHFHYKDGRIVDEWTVYDELSMLVQIKLAQLADVSAAMDLTDDF